MEFNLLKMLHNEYIEKNVFHREKSNFSCKRTPTGVSGGIYYEGIYMVKVILTEMYMLEHFL